MPFRNQHSVILILLVFAVSCKEKPKLKLSDLKFADYYIKQQIAKNRIDTTFFISASNSPLSSKGEIDAYETYDKFGNVLTSWYKPFNVFQYKYDSLGFITEDSSYYDGRGRLKYSFNPDSLTLYEYRHGSSLDTSVYHFDILGKVISEDRPFHSWNHNKTIYKYDDSGKLLNSSTRLIYSQKEGVIMAESFTNYFYSNNKLDSTITDGKGHNSVIQRVKTYYDSLGLRTKTLADDTIETYYIHKQRTK